LDSLSFENEAAVIGRFLFTKREVLPSCCLLAEIANANLSEMSHYPVKACWFLFSKIKRSFVYQMQGCSIFKKSSLHQAASCYLFSKRYGSSYPFYFQKRA
jgi:hypothetical protein